MQDGRYRIELELADGQVIELHFLLATLLYAKPRHVRDVIGNVLDPIISDEQIGLALWMASSQADEELELAGIDGNDRKVARQRYATYLAAIELLRRRLIDLSSSPAEQEKKMGDASARVLYDLRVLKDLLDKVQIELERWRSALVGGTKIRGAVKGGTADPYPLDGRVWN